MSSAYTIIEAAPHPEIPSAHIGDLSVNLLQRIVDEGRDDLDMNVCFFLASPWLNDQLNKYSSDEPILAVWGPNATSQSISDYHADTEFVIERLWWFKKSVLWRVQKRELHHRRDECEARRQRVLQGRREMRLLLS